ncbi:MAG: esterase-like activity of phytase family protein [Mangrovicoccus sp.]
MIRWLFPLLLLACGAAQAQEARHISTHVWTEPEQANFGGLSGLELSPDGQKFVAITDRSFVITGEIQRQNGKISALAASAPQALRASNGQAFAGRMVDSEGLACPNLTESPLCYVSFEHGARVERFSDLSAPAKRLPIPPEFVAMQPNSALEALAIDAQGRLYTLPERSGALDRPFPVFRFENGTWRLAFTLRRDPPHLPTGADIGPDGRFYLLERHHAGFLQFSTRLRSFDISTGQAKDERLHFETPLGQHDNLEALAIWRDGSDQLRATMLSDDNFLPLQRTEIVEYALNPSP